MIIAKSKGGYKNDQQWGSGLFLIAFSSADDSYTIPGRCGLGWCIKPRKLDRIWCAVRQARLEQCGHWMMGGMTLAGHYFALSGDFGGDGLTKDWRPMARAIDDGIYAKKGDYVHVDMSDEAIADLKARVLTPMPEEVSTAYWLDTTGWNYVGHSRHAIRTWALQNIEALTKIRKPANTRK